MLKKTTHAQKSGHSSHPLRNAAYLLLTLLMLAAFIGIFWFWSVGNILLVILCAFVSGVSAAVGIFHSMAIRKK